MFLDQIPLLWRAGRLASQVTDAIRVKVPYGAHPGRVESLRPRRHLDSLRTRGGRDLVQIAVAGYKHPLFIRGGTSDLEVMLQLMVHHELGFELDFDPRWIVDLGANIGLSAVYLANRFPRARIVAVEVEQANFELLLRNCAFYPQVLPVFKAVWSHSGLVRISNPDAQPWAFRVAPTSRDDPTAIEAVSIVDLLAQFGIEEVDLLKMDIEGAEREVLANGASNWLDRTRVFAVELHERHVPGCTAALEGALSGRRYQRILHGEYEILTLAKR